MAKLGDRFSLALGARERMMYSTPQLARTKQLIEPFVLFHRSDPLTSDFQGVGNLRSVMGVEDEVSKLSLTKMFRPPCLAFPLAIAVVMKRHIVNHCFLGADVLNRDPQK